MNERLPQIIRWEDPAPLPTGRRPSTRWVTVASELRASPGRWAVVRIYGAGRLSAASTLAHRIKSGKMAAFRPGGDFEATIRTAEDGSATVYARYLDQELPA